MICYSLLKPGGGKCLWQILGVRTRACFQVRFFLLSFLCRCVNIYCLLLPHTIDFVLLSSLRASSSLFVKEKESELRQSTENAFTFQFIPFSLEIVAHCGWTGSWRLEPISRRRRVWESIVCRVLHHFLRGSGQTDLCKQSVQWQIVESWNLQFHVRTQQ